MAADLHIHIKTDAITDDVLAAFFSNSLGSKWFSLRSARDTGKWEEAYETIANTPQVHVGEVSWLKAAVLEDGDQFIPAPVASISQIIGEDMPTIDDELISKVAEALRLPNQTGYEMTGENKILSFLAEHKGRQAFVVSW